MPKSKTVHEAHQTYCRTKRSYVRYLDSLLQHRVFGEQPTPYLTQRNILVGCMMQMGPTAISPSLWHFCSAKAFGCIHHKLV